MRKYKSYIVTAVVVVALAAIWQFSKEPVKNTGESRNQEQKTNNTNETVKPANNTSEETSMDKVWEGTLTVSDNQAKGNLKLTTKDRVIYIKTSRDYSALIGKQVKVSYEGTLESFRLGDIVAK